MNLNQLRHTISLIALVQTGLLHAQDSHNVYTYREPSLNGTGKIYMGREIAKIMSFEGVAWLERNTRSQEENTNLAISRLPFSKKSVVADIGAVWILYIQSSAQGETSLRSRDSK
jgi:hypothetical protein